jgi:hypothetical protein
MSETVVNLAARMVKFSPMKRTDVLLAALSAADRRYFYPVHLQKTLFLIDRKLPNLFDQRYDFQPYDYGPFDKQVYADAELLRTASKVEIAQPPGEWYRIYCATDSGLEVGRELLTSMPTQSAAVVRQIANVVTGLSFRELVAAIYRSFPDMKVNSIFKENNS